MPCEDVDFVYQPYIWFLKEEKSVENGKFRILSQLAFKPTPGDKPLTF